MKKIVFIIPYFGHFNNYFDIWLNSCKNNPTVNWIIFTDCTDAHPYPDNVKVVNITFDELRKKAQLHFDFPISLEKPYKLCDLKPAYGDIFYDYIRDYDFWGYCDVDLIWGDIRKFVTDELLSRYDKIGNKGHCVLVRNDEKMRRAYRYESSVMPTYREAFSSDLAYCFDENNAFGRYCRENGVKTCENYTFFDVSVDHDDYRISRYGRKQFEYDAHNVFEYSNGKLFVIWVKRGTSEMHKKEILYAHFQKRSMQVEIDQSCFDRFLIWGDCFRTSQNQLTADDIKRYDPKSLKCRLLMKILWRKVKAEYLHGSGVKYYKYQKK